MTLPTEAIAFRDHLRAHLANEEEMLKEYEKVIGDSEEDYVAYLAQLILDDERRHHEMFRRLHNTVDSSIGWQHLDPQIPRLRADRIELDELLKLTRKLLAAERQDQRELRRLRRHLRRQRIRQRPTDRQLWALLIESAELDTAKHTKILRFIEHALMAGEAATRPA